MKVKTCTACASEFVTGDGTQRKCPRCHRRGRDCARCGTRFTPPGGDRWQTCWTCRFPPPKPVRDEHPEDDPPEPAPIEVPVRYRRRVCWDCRREFRPEAPRTITCEPCGGRTLPRGYQGPAPESATLPPLPVAA